MLSLGKLFPCRGVLLQSRGGGGEKGISTGDGVSEGGGAKNHDLLRRGLTHRRLLRSPAGGALMLYVNETAQPLRAPRTGFAVSRSCKRKGRRDWRSKTLNSYSIWVFCPLFGNVPTPHFPCPPRSLQPPPHQPLSSASMQLLCNLSPWLWNIH